MGSRYLNGAGRAISGADVVLSHARSRDCLFSRFDGGFFLISPKNMQTLAKTMCFASIKL
jgi:hypothetical protein